MLKQTLALCVALLGLSSPALAQVKVAEVDVDRVIKEFPEKANIERKLKVMRDRINKKVQGAGESLRRLRSMLRQAPAERRAELEREFRAAAGQLNKLRKESSLHMREVFGKIQGAIISDIKRVSAKLAKERGFALVVSRRRKDGKPRLVDGLLYRGQLEITDITSELLTRLRKEQEGRVEAARARRLAAKRRLEAQKKPRSPRGKPRLY